VLVGAPGGPLKLIKDVAHFLFGSRRSVSNVACTLDLAHEAVHSLQPLSDWLRSHTLSRNSRTCTSHMAGKDNVIFYQHTSPLSSFRQQTLYFLCLAPVLPDTSLRPHYLCPSVSTLFWRMVHPSWKPAIIAASGSPSPTPASIVAPNPAFGTAIFCNALHFFAGASEGYANLGFNS
jgi:hypothetical protein